MPQEDGPKTLPHAQDRVDGWIRGWEAHGGIVVLLDFDGTLAPIVERPDAAAIPETTRAAVQRLIAAPGAHVAVVSGRGLADARTRAGLEGIPYAGNHGMEIQGGGIERIHPEAAAARPRLEEVRERLSQDLASIPGAIVEDKGLTLSIHYRLVMRNLVDTVRTVVSRTVEAIDHLRLTEGKEVLEVRPAVDWHKGRAVEFLLTSIRPTPGTPIIYIGDDRTDEDAFEVLQEVDGGEGVVVADEPPAGTAASSFVRSPEEVASLIQMLVKRAPA